MKSARILAVLFGFCFAVTANAYELATHGQLTYHAYLQSALAKDGTLLDNLGLKNLSVDEPFGTAYYDFTNSEIKTRYADPFESSNGRMPAEVLPLSLPGWLLRGAIREDDVQVLSATIGGAHDLDPYGGNIRVVNHFYDPVRDIPLTLFPATGTISALGQKAPDWATGASDVFNAPNTPQAARRNHFTVFDAREAMYRALTGKKQDGSDIEKNDDQAERHKYWATTFRALGDIVHLVEDRPEPPHTRNVFPIPAAHGKRSLA